MDMSIKPIGYIETPYKNRTELSVPPFKPESPYRNPEVHGTLHIFNEYGDGLKGVEPGSYGMIIFHFNQSKGYELITRSARLETETGVFSTRSPNRPNGIGVTVVKYLSINGCDIEFSGVDMLDGTPILDIKPYSGEQLPGR